ncbi:hypothetical protein Cri9333_2237 [Crinalium epipsammum PCC 9333]|uniref:Uncharacterized protein n=1 Tax=Crinalium epipsammum PCC 9333 TaxID=1173022 RepID=K9VYB5_9CYAN|nr:hypothetical protein [Crinalium epipsammum]AFZ13108.1 hypothetical protein Cri9333_2237 [Crinalium epipsammum PCC 9333]
MARYTCSFILAVPIGSLQQGIIEVLESCNFDIVYNTPDNIMAREIPGKVSYAKLARAEVLIERATATEKEVRINVVVKNEELPLQVENHCHQMFDRVHQGILEYRHWQLVESVVG